MILECGFRISESVDNQHITECKFRILRMKVQKHPHIPKSEIHIPKSTLHFFKTIDSTII